MEWCAVGILVWYTYLAVLLVLSYLLVSNIVTIFAGKKGRISQCKSHLNVVNEVTAFEMYVLSVIL